MWSHKGHMVLTPHCMPHRELPRDAGVRVGGTSHGVNPIWVG